MQFHKISGSAILLACACLAACDPSANDKVEQLNSESKQASSPRTDAEANPSDTAVYITIWLGREQNPVHRLSPRQADRFLDAVSRPPTFTGGSYGGEPMIIATIRHKANTWFVDPGAFVIGESRHKHIYWHGPLPERMFRIFMKVRATTLDGSELLSAFDSQPDGPPESMLVAFHSGTPNTRVFQLHPGQSAAFRRIVARVPRYVPGSPEQPCIATITTVCGERYILREDGALSVRFLDYQKQWKHPKLQHAVSEFRTNEKTSTLRSMLALISILTNDEQ